MNDFEGLRETLRAGYGFEEAAITPYGHEALVRRGVKRLRGVLGNRSR